MAIFHLSHTDLDGYGAQFITNFYFDNIKFFNSNYGKEINEKFAQILNLIDTEFANETNLILITDLNLTLSQCLEFQNLAGEKNAKILLLDHHQSGEECAKKHGWYLLDSSRCATKITYDFFSDLYGKNEMLDKFVRVVNAVDIWLDKDSEFELGKVCLGLVSGAKEINKVMFEKESFSYIQFLISAIPNFFDIKNSHIALDNAIHGLKKEFFKTEKDDTLSNLISNFVVGKLSAQKDKFIIKFGEKTGILTYNIGNTSVIGNDFLVKNHDVDFFIDVTSKKTLSFRANGNANVSEMAKILVGGGGHINASGGMFAGFKDSNSYENIKTQIVNLIDKKLSETKENQNEK